MVLSHGADAERLRGVGQQLTASAQSLDDAATTGRGMAQVLAEHWSGADLEHFVGRGWPGAETVLHSASELVREMGEGATRNADEQDSTSQGAGRAGGGAAGPLPTLPADEAVWKDPGVDSPDQGSLDPEVYDMWMELDPAEQQAVLQQIVNEECAKMGVEPAPTVKFEAPEGPGGGGWDGETLTIDPASIAVNPRWAISAAAHEARHVVQREAMDMANPPWWQFWNRGEDMAGVDPGLVDAWTENEDTGYHGLPDPDLEETNPDAYEEQLQAYYDQPIEADAYRAGKDYVNEMTPEEMERLIEASGG